MRMGLHANNQPTGNGIEWFKRYVREVRPSAVKFLEGNHALMDYCHEHGVKVVLRRVETVGLGATGWRTIRSKLLPKYREYRGYADYFEVFNEEHQGRENPEDMNRMAALCLDFAKALDDEGNGKAIGFNFSVGQPELKNWNQLDVIRCLNYYADHGHLIGFHEYYKPEPWQDVEGGRAGWANLSEAEGWLMLRLVKSVREMQNAAGVCPGVAITESGRDDVPSTPGHGKGYRDEPKTTVDGRDHWYYDKMYEYGLHLNAIPQVKLWVDYGAFTTQPEKWGSFDMYGDEHVFSEMIHRQAQLPASVVEPPPPPPPPPPDPSPPGGDMGLKAKLRKKGDHNQVIFPNPGASLTKAAVAKGYFAPISNEYKLVDKGVEYVAMVFAAPTDPGKPSDERIYYAPTTDFNDVKGIPRKKD